MQRVLFAFVLCSPFVRGQLFQRKFATGTASISDGATIATNTLGSRPSILPVSSGLSGHQQQAMVSYLSPRMDALAC